MEADVTTHHIHGYMNGDNGPEEVHIPVWSHIYENVWMGGYQPIPLPDDFNYVISLYPWEKYEIPDGCSRIEVKMHDSSRIPDPDLLHALGEFGADLASKGKLYVHCQAGLNRSGLITSKILMSLTGWTPEKTIAHIREKRSKWVLCNKEFEGWLLENH